MEPPQLLAERRSACHSVQLPSWAPEPVWDMSLIFKHAEQLQGELLNEPVSVTLANAQIEITVA